jgi:amino acid transporter
LPDILHPLFSDCLQLFLLEHVLEVLYPGSFAHAGLVIILVFAVLNLIGVDLFSRAQNLLAYLMLAGMIIIGLVGLTNTVPKGLPIEQIAAELENINLDVLSLTMLALWSFFGLEFICPMIEEAKNPVKNIPKTMLLAAVILFVVYSMLALSAYRMLPADELTNSEIPHWLLILELFGENGKIIMALLAITATCSTINTVIATLSRMLFGMARNNQLPKFFMKVHPRTKTPWVGIIFVASIILIPMFILRGQDDIILTLMISAGTIWLVAYIIAHVDLLVLRKKIRHLIGPSNRPCIQFLKFLE